MRTNIRMLLGAAGCLVLAACTAGAPRWEAQLGDTVRQSRALQTLDPDAPTKNTGMTLLDGQAAQEAHWLYIDSFKAPPPQNVINIGIGAPSTSGGR